MAYLDYPGLQRFKGKLDDTYSAVIVRTLSGENVIIKDGGANNAVDSFVVDIDSQSAVSTVTIERFGENYSGASKFVDSEYYNDSGVPTSSNNFKRDDRYLPVTPGDKWIIRYTGTARNIRVHEYAADKTWLRQIVKATNTNETTWTVSNDAAFIRYNVARNATDIIAGPYKKYEIEIPEAAGSVTAATLDVTNGVLTVGGTDYEVDPVEITTAAGENTFSADCGDCEIKYKPDPELYYIANLLAEDGSAW